MKPNIFKYATTELSQDAFLCWLLDWANDSNSEFDTDLNLVAQDFIDELVGKKLTDYHVEVRKQLENIDVSAIINNTYFVVIEDKKGTSEHSNQLVKYSNYVKQNKKWEHLEKKLIYFKMEEQSDLKGVESAKFVHFERGKMLKVLSTYFDSVLENNQNNILQDYYNKLVKIDRETLSYKTLPIKNWTEYSWKGFFHNLQQELLEFDPSWGNVPNASGGFQGFFWNWLTPNPTTPTFYLQIESTGLLTFRLESGNFELNKEYRDIFKRNLQKVAAENQIELADYGGRGKVGKTMGVLKLNEDFIKQDADGLLDFPTTVSFLKIISNTMTDSVTLLGKSSVI